MSKREKKYTFTMRVEQDVQDAIDYLKNCGYSVSFKLKLYLIDLCEKEKLRQELVK